MERPRRGAPRSKRWPYDGGIHVPLIVRWPGEVDGGGVDERLVSMMDLGPTTMDACGLDVPQYVGGRRFLGPDADEREYVFATRDRYDEAYDMVRAVRDHRFKYVRHYRPGTPYRQWIPFRNRHPVMRQILERAREGDLEGAEQWFGARRPAEELYDLRADPYEVVNLADDPEYADTLQRFRDALDEWRERVDDTGDVAEERMVWEQYQGDEQPETAAPRFVVNSPDHDERTARTDGLNLEGPATVSFYCATQGPRSATRSRRTWSGTTGANRSGGSTPARSSCPRARPSCARRRSATGSPRATSRSGRSSSLSDRSRGRPSEKLSVRAVNAVPIGRTA
ncbi:sulfatase/phosphatase domain-containing protein [Halosimplex aquaticum]